MIKCLFFGHKWDIVEMGPELFALYCVRCNTHMFLY